VAVKGSSAGSRESLWVTLLDTLFPPHCVACGAAGEWFCRSCMRSIPGEGRLGQVRRLSNASHWLAGALTLSPHVSPLRQGVHALKYGGMRVLAEPLGSLLATGWRQQSRQADCVVPVPLHPRNQRRRGYNQAELLARVLAEQTGLRLCA
jgi:predicted amidophosphoribosyltransferase